MNKDKTTELLPLDKTFLYERADNLGLDREAYIAACSRYSEVLYTGDEVGEAIAAYLSATRPTTVNTELLEALKAFGKINFHNLGDIPNENRLLGIAQNLAKQAISNATAQE